MKHILALIALLPCAAFAQDAAYHAPHPSVRVSYVTISMHNDNMTITNESRKPGQLIMAGDSLHLPGPVHVNMDATGHPIDNHWIIVAHDVEIAHDASAGTLKADILSYNDKTHTGILYGHVTAVENGEKKNLGKRIKVDFSDNKYRLVSAW